MATETSHDLQTDVESMNWKAGIAGGIVAAIVMGVLMLLMNEAVIAVAIPSMYFLAPPPTVPVGMAVHVFHGAVLGLVFAGVASVLRFESPGTVLGLGIAWGILVWIALAALLMPIWLSVVGSPASPPFPNFAPPSLFWHVVYGVVLGAVYVALIKSR
jgi:hypothetical protein